MWAREIEIQLHIVRRYYQEHQNVLVVDKAQSPVRSFQFMTEVIPQNLFQLMTLSRRGVIHTQYSIAQLSCGIVGSHSRYRLL